jgi:4-alpha-glucanotransferase
VAVAPGSGDCVRTDIRAYSRASGVLLHPTSLPGGEIGDIGEVAYQFVDWLADAGQSYWQILPLVPVDGGGSPYNGLSAMAGNPLLISPSLLERNGWLDAGWSDERLVMTAEHVDFDAAARAKSSLLDRAYDRAIAARAGWHATFEEFQDTHGRWLPDYTLFRAIREFQGGAAWCNWPEPLKRREPAAIAQARAELAVAIDRYAFQEFLFETQWQALRRYANSRGIRIIGDIPIFVAYDSADVWSHPEIFELDEDGRPRFVSGVPPDYFSATGQRWGNPLYRWDVLAAQRYDWWVDRFRRTFDLVDVARIDHFRGFESYWKVPAADPTAINGQWVVGPGSAFFMTVEERLGALPLIAEDLGLITPAVEQLRDELGYPGMRVLQFAFDGDPENPHLPANYPVAVTAYTGTHDNDTIIGWWASATADERCRVLELLDGCDPDHWSFVETVMESNASIAIIPIQDLLGLGSEARMNTPGEAADNWTWRMKAIPAPTIADRLRGVTLKTGRTRSTPVS